MKIFCPYCKCDKEVGSNHVCLTCNKSVIINAGTKVNRSKLPKRADQANRPR